jgi:glycosyltransferase involved in cell wall biosynthesis
VSEPRVALVHDWLTGMRGGERVLEAMCEMYPRADIFTLVHRKGSVSPTIERHRIRTSVVQYLPKATTRYANYLPLFPFAIEQLSLDGYDLVLSSSHCAAKSVVVPGRAVHVCYCHSPMRYAWDQFDAYFGPARVGRVKSRWLYRPVLSRLARWDASTAGRVNRFLANSAHIAGRIRRYYNRESTIVYPPVDTVFFHPADVAPESHFLIVSALVPYKRIDLAIDACGKIGAPLRIIGDGPERKRLEQQAGSRVTFLGWMSADEIRNEYRRAAAVIMPGEEDFGLVPVEAQACGCPTIALARGGALETVKDGETGVLFAEASVPSLTAALEHARTISFNRSTLRAHAEQFARERYDQQLRTVIEDTLAAPTGTRW